MLSVGTVDTEPVCDMQHAGFSTECQGCRQLVILTFSLPDMFFLRTNKN